MTDLGSVLYKLRVDNLLTQKQVAEIVGVSDKAVSTWERGFAKPNMDCLILLSSFYDVPLTLLTHGKVNQRKDIIEYEESEKENKKIDFEFVLLCLLIVMISVNFLFLFNELYLGVINISLSLIIFFFVAFNKFRKKENKIYKNKNIKDKIN